MPARVTVPELSRHHVPRPRLASAMRAALTGRLTLVVAPAGYGKTAAVVEALDGLSARVVWLTIDHADLTVPGRARRHLDVAVEAASAAAGPGDLVVVLDDVGGVTAGPDAVPVDRLVEGLPRAARVVLLARQRPAWSAGTWQARADIAEFGIDDLRMTREEVAGCLATGGLEPDAATVDRVVDDTEGWPAAVALVAAHTRRPFLAPGTGGRASLPLDEYVRDVVLAGLTPRERHALDHLLALDDVDGPRCAVATGWPDGDALVDALSRRGLLLPDPQRPGSVRPHRLLRRGLRHLTPDEEAARRRGGARVARWLAARHRWFEAVSCALAVDDVAPAIGWLDTGLHEVVVRDGGATLRLITSRMPPEVVASRPCVAMAAADACALAGDREGLERLLDVHDGAGAAGLPQRVEQHLARLHGDHAPDGDTNGHVRALALAAEGRHDEAARLLRGVVEVAVHECAPLYELIALADLAWARALAGRLGEADLLVRRVARQAARAGVVPLPARARLAQAQIALDRGHAETALRWTAEVRDHVGTTDDLATWAEALLLVGRAHGVRGELLAAGDALDVVQARLAEAPPGGSLALRVARAEAGLRLAMGDTDSLAVFLPELAGQGSPDDVPPADRLLLARVHVRHGELARAHQLVASICELGAGPRLEAEAARVLAVVARARGDVVVSRRARARAAEIGRAEGMLALVPPRPPRGRPPTPVPELVPAPDTAEAFRPHAPALLGPPLTQREEHVLRLLPSRLSNVEIAGQLYVSVNTVKSHLKSIYRKLGVATRRDAIARARDLGLLT